MARHKAIAHRALLSIAMIAAGFASGWALGQPSAWREGYARGAEDQHARPPINWCQVSPVFCEIHAYQPPLTRDEKQ